MLPEPDSSSQYSSLHLHKFRNDTFDRLPVEKKCLIREFEGNVLVERGTFTLEIERIIFSGVGMRSSLLLITSIDNVQLRIYYNYFVICIISGCSKFCRCECSVIQVSVYCMQRVLGDVSMFVVGKDEYDELACNVITSAMKDLCEEPPTECPFLDKYGKICLCLDEIVWKSLVENTDKETCMIETTN
ncbi:hypothetical protein SASPL_113031 [Salvia splendens]|uniref:Coatomer subunit zeta n=1 Tax=Salvia splendens TaxID=180675 RepID=A0A8X9A0N9_SALSN|nr:hypothetical protein SASPL_113031 [Salvia splendens]